MKKLLKFIVIITLLISLAVFLKCDATVIVNDAAQLNSIAVQKILIPKSSAEIQKLVAEHVGPISIGGGRYSQGGQIATENCLFIDMRHLNRILNIDVRKKTITVEAGATWRKIQEAIDAKGLSVAIMQSFSNFTVGGSLSVNAHGRYVGKGPLIESVNSIKIVLANGSLITASRNMHADIFYSAIGGYGGIGVIVEATLNLVENTHIQREANKMKLAEYKNYYLNVIAKSKKAIMHNADIYPPDYTRLYAITWYLTDKPVTIKEKLAPQKKLSWSEQLLLLFISNSDLGKYLREYIYDPILFASGSIVESRNYEASLDLISLEPISRKTSTYALQEYFIPEKNFYLFTSKMVAALKNYHVNVLNISIRHANADKHTLLSWARENVFSFVIYYKQGQSQADRLEANKWSNELINAALNAGGSYYLPYQIMATPKQFMMAYPNAPLFFSIKRHVDPTYKFRNKLWDSFYPDNGQCKKMHN